MEDIGVVGNTRLGAIVKVKPYLFSFGMPRHHKTTLLVILLATWFCGCAGIAIGPYDDSPLPTPFTTIPELIEATTHPDYKVRFSAVVALGKLGPEAEMAVPALVSSLSDDVSDIRTAAAYALRDIGPAANPAIPTLVKMLETDEAESARTAAADALGELNDTHVVPSLAEVLYDETASQSLMINAARSIAHLTKNSFTDSAPGAHGYHLDSNGTPVLVIEVRNWWETEGQFYEWSIDEPQQ